MRPIIISLSPNTERDDVLLAIKVLFSPWLWFSKRNIHLLEEKFPKMFSGNYKSFATNSGRSALYLILKSLGVKKDDEVLLQAFTCIAVPNAILWAGAIPVYVDIDETYNIDPKDLEKKITKKTKAIIVQHTFGILGDVGAIKRIARKNNLVLIEDCAHSLGATFNGKRVGTLGDVAFFSFGRDKILSSVFGGMILVKTQTQTEIQIQIQKMFNTLKWPNTLWGIQQLLHPIAFSVILPLYNSGLGKLILLILQKFHFLSRAVCEEEKRGEQPKTFPSRMPPALSVLAIKQLTKLERFNRHRREIAKLYFSKFANIVKVLPPDVSGAVWLRFPISINDAFGLISYAKRRGILFGDWYKSVVMPAENLSKVGYTFGTCPNAEKLSKMVVNLPTYPGMKVEEVLKVVEVVREWEGEEGKRGGKGNRGSRGMDGATEVV
ncbi:MAG: aminotransferase class I/II-fold pyridoxal phosphate-dependent enzyme [Candidatus Blackburnbacteria bacterium]|nr:aminotransferase class I/II-fold pyridoxal phosphate-dependent enzyme [Candidatus Blackburnbacteria bacterium]